ncbi:MAG: type I 3-dehydroquinate dehydratase [Candidatus Omnitrophica bacterium]|nr:type I 3-dehydroquinate dehydratase [Candidatus Omnitrophota bacterium]
MININSRIALVVTDQETNAQIKDLGVGLLELRADLFKKLDSTYIINQIQNRRLLKTPLLLTLRNDKKEGAVKIFSNQLKEEIIEKALPFVDMVDIELSSPLYKKVIAQAKKQKVKVIASIHHLQDTPKSLVSYVKKAKDADILKIAARANSMEDVMRMLDFTRCYKKRGLITMCLGELGALSRLVFPGIGSLYTYAFLNKPTASGQIDVKTLKDHLKIYYSYSK